MQSSINPQESPNRLMAKGISQLLSSSLQTPSQSLNQDDILTRLVSVLIKEPTERNNLDQSHLNKFVSASPFFKSLSAHFSHEFGKSLVKNSQISRYEYSQIVVRKKENVHNVYILLKGECAVLEYDEFPEVSFWKALDALIEQHGRRSKAHRKVKSKHKDMVESDLGVFNDTQMTPKLQAQCFLDIESLKEGLTHTMKIVCSKPSTIMRIPLHHFYECLLNEYQKRMGAKIQLFRKIQAFEILDKMRLQHLIERLTPIKRTKQQFLFKEGDKATKFYMLIEGEIQICKNISVFVENPNELYKNRSAICSNKMADSTSLPYADFSRVYNYQPMTKSVILGLITPVSLFGEEQIAENILREVSARVVSLSARLYQIGMQDIEEVCILSGQPYPSVSDFVEHVSGGMTAKKILHRQSKLAELIAVENKNNLTLLSEENRNKRSCRRQAISKLNKTIKALDSPSFPTSISTFNSVTLNSAVHSSNSLGYGSTTLKLTSPTFDSFNFNELVQTEALTQINFTLEESRIAKLMHNAVNEPQKKNDKIIRIKSTSTHKGKSLVKSRATQISIGNNSQSKELPKIDIENPLFQVGYFSHQEKQQRRLFLSAKKKKLEFIERLSSHRK